MVLGALVGHPVGGAGALSVSTVMHMVLTAVQSHAFCGRMSHMLPKSSEYDKATQDMAREWVNEQHPHLGAGETWDRLHAEACAHLNLVHNARWKP